MGDCKNIVHPFQQDPGISQSQRTLQSLEKTAPPVDGRSMADLLDCFMQLSRHINFYDEEMTVSDWQPFFSKSIPFTLASISKYNVPAVNEKFDLYRSMFLKRPGKPGLQLLVYYFYYTTIYRINAWHLVVKGTGLPFENILQSLIQDRLSEPVTNFILLTKAAVYEDCMVPIDFTSLFSNDVWKIDQSSLQYCEWRKDGQRPLYGHRERLLGLIGSLTAIWPAFTEAIRLLASVAGDSIEDSLSPLKEELKQKHPPHLALLFAFLKLFRHLQDDLNGYSRKHLDFFFKDVLRIGPRPATADKAHIVFEIQKQWNDYLLTKGIVLKDGKDINGSEIFFATDDEIVVNKAQATDLRTLFLNTEPANDDIHLRLVEGVYAAPAANKADGIKEEFKDSDPKNWPTLGAQYSKFIETGENFPKPYPYARIGFVLSSPVLLLNEGTRKVTFTLSCSINTDCMLTNETPVIQTFFGALQSAIDETYIIVTKKLILEAATKGIGEATIQQLYGLLPEIPKNSCCSGEPVLRKNKVQLTKQDWNTRFFNSISANEQAILQQLFKDHRVFKVAYSGKDAWLEPLINKIGIALINGKYVLTIETEITPDKPAITFFDKDKLKEELNTKLPVVKIELDNEVRIDYMPATGPAPDEKCCFEKCPKEKKQAISLYQFFRNLTIVQGDKPNTTRIDVKVCGLKNFIVQNDENVMDINGLIFPFGTRPKINSNFYIGSEEIFLKKWSDIAININWKDLPTYSPPAPDPLHGKPWETYYNGYQDFFIKAKKQVNVVEDAKFRMQLAVLQDGTWNQWKYLEDCDHAGAPQCQLFQLTPGGLFCDIDKEYTHQFRVSRTTDFSGTGLGYPQEPFAYNGVKRYEVNSRQNFIRLTLKCQDFQHEKYAYVLARQMAALGKLPEIVDGAVYFGVTLNGTTPVFKTLNIPVILNELFEKYEQAINPPGFSLDDNSKKIILNILTVANTGNRNNADIKKLWDLVFTVDDPTTIAPNDPPLFTTTPANTLNQDNSFYYDRIHKILEWLRTQHDVIKELKDKGVVIPNAPWTPTIKNMALDYAASAPITDIDLIHLYPYENTYKAEEIEGQPTLIPTYCEQGSLFIGLKDLVPNDTVNILFQMAEATANSEAGIAELHWHYLMNNEWKELRQGFEVLSDDTNGLTTSGIIKFSMPGNISTGNTIMPKELHWIRASAIRSVEAVSETIGIHTQAIRATFIPDAQNDLSRLSGPLEANKLSKLKEADANVKKVAQPYESFGGREPEASGYYYTRVSEWLHHKGRAIQKFDYERLVLDAFPQLFKVKCINHDFALDARQYLYDVNVAPGYVLVAVIPDLKQLKAGQSFEPKAPVSLLEKITAFLHKRTTPFARIRVMNPRYEKIDICLEVQLVKGKDKNYYRHKLENDIRLFLAPWAIGEYDKLRFGQCVNRSDLVRFIESLDYVDYILCLKMMLENDCDKNPALTTVNQICPLTPRSILIGGEIDVCIPDKDCENWENEQESCIHRYEVSPVACKPIVPTQPIP